ncbi:hypothetical protein B0A58_05660 [Flavobacterium branchiophilum NBRC 15030 = ATCC 35035]|uniref:Glycosyltransferase involved in cell wall biosynthesis n=1 Tax=Flavobacterium branchiophilum TaxID=55197 RepID=A0A543G0W5_9FLAO|nr:glycosyltransferase [Flavobacterium branchiophilum]OXA77455.1 hypothetical protein B0A58_05660 [Flavobacterium branchiophilum NBRC 15030 = ATCC 35035]TQM39713.1 glycosyltransferase involved in cell wall biosynthesis [Flavobacterium branchiophilum]
MKIAYIVPSILDEGGVARILSIKTHYLITHLQYEIAILSQIESHETPFYTFHPDIEWVTIPFNKKAIKSIFVYYKYLNNWLVNYNPDLIVVCDNGLKSFLLPFLVKYPKPLLYEVHSTVSVDNLNGKKISHRIYNYFKNKYKHFGINQFSKVVLETPSAINDWKCSNATVIANPIWFSSAQKSELKNPLVIAVGRHVYEKGFDQLLSIWSQLIPKYPTWKLAIYGNESSDMDLKKRAKDLQIDNNVIFYNAVKNIQDAYINAAIFAMTSRFEAFGMVLIEAMECGLPCIAYNCPNGPKEIIQHQINGFLVQNSNEVSYLEFLEQLMVDESLRIKMGKESAKLAKKYELDQIMYQWHELFLSCCNKN